MLHNMTARGVTIFLTSHVLEIVERLCSHVAIIHKGRIIAQGSLDELRAGVAAAAHPDGAAIAAGDAGKKLTLEEIFLAIVGGEGTTVKSEDELSWLK
jgi:ABC-2 type transport system ATP-binding protein